MSGGGCSGVPSAERAPPPASAWGRKPDDVTRWNDRTTPRKTLESFYFAISGYDRSPGPDRQRHPDCLDLKALDPAMRGEERGVAGPSGLEFVLESPGHPTLRSPRSPRLRNARGAGRGGRAATLPGPTARRPMAVRPRHDRADRAAEEKPGLERASARLRKAGRRWPRAGPTPPRRCAHRSPGKPCDGPGYATSRWRPNAWTCRSIHFKPPRMRRGRVASSGNLRL